jgi:hypothetical protein
MICPSPKRERGILRPSFTLRVGIKDASSRPRDYPSLAVGFEWQDAKCFISIFSFWTNLYLETSQKHFYIEFFVFRHDDGLDGGLRFLEAGEKPSCAERFYSN